MQPGFGHSAWPTPQKFAYTFDHLADVMLRFTEVLGLSDYRLFMQDYGGPVGFRMAIVQPKHVGALIVQNAVVHESGLTSLWEARRAFWTDRGPHEAELRRNLLSLEATRRRHVGSDPDVGHYDPDLWTDEFRFLNQPVSIGVQG